MNFGLRTILWTAGSLFEGDGPLSVGAGLFIPEDEVQVIMRELFGGELAMLSSPPFESIVPLHIATTVPNSAAWSHGLSPRNNFIVINESVV